MTPMTSPDIGKNKTKVSKVPRRYMLLMLLSLFVVSFLTICNQYEIISVDKTVLIEGEAEMLRNDPRIIESYLGLASKHQEMLST